MERKGCLSIFLIFCLAGLLMPCGVRADGASAPAPSKTPKASASVETYLAAANRLFEKLEAYNSILEGVNDKATAEAAKPKIEKLLEEYKVVVQEAQDLGEPDAATEKKMNADPKMQSRAIAVQTNMVKVTNKIAKMPDALAVLKPTLASFQKVSQEARKRDAGSVTTEPLPAKRVK